MARSNRDWLETCAFMSFPGVGDELVRVFVGNMIGNAKF
jgi:hypothetical protein